MSDSPKDEFDQFLEQYGIANPPRYLSEKAAPPVDDDRLRALVRGELDADESHEICALIGLFRSWGETYLRIRLEEPAALELAAFEKKNVGEVCDVGHQSSNAGVGGESTPGGDDRRTATAVDEMLSGFADDVGVADGRATASGTIDIAGSTVMMAATPPDLSGVNSEQSAQLLPILRELLATAVQHTTTLQDLKTARPASGDAPRPLLTERKLVIGFMVMVGLALLTLLILAIAVIGNLTGNRRTTAVPTQNALAESPGKAGEVDLKDDLANLRQQVTKVDDKLGATQHDLQSLIRPTNLSALHREMKTLTGHRDAVKAVAFFPGDKQLATGSADGCVTVWDVSEKKEREVLTFNTFSEIRNLALVGNGRWLAVACEDAKVRVWDLEKRQLIKSYEGDAVAGTHQQTTLAVVNKTGFVHFIDLSSVTESRRFRIVADDRRLMAISFCTVDPSGTQLAIGFRSERATKPGEMPTVAVNMPPWEHGLWDISKGQKTASFDEGKASPALCVYSPDAALIATHVPRLEMPIAGHQTVTRDQEERLIDVGQEINIFKRDNASKQMTLKCRGGIRCVGYSPDSRYLVVGTRRGNVIVWDLSTGRVVCTIYCHNDEILGIAISSDGNHVATACKDGTAKIWDFRAISDEHRTIEKR